MTHVEGRLLVARIQRDGRRLVAVADDHTHRPERDLCRVQRDGGRRLLHANTNRLVARERRRCEIRRDGEVVMVGKHRPRQPLRERRDRRRDEQHESKQGWFHAH